MCCVEELVVGTGSTLLETTETPGDGGIVVELAGDGDEAVAHEEDGEGEGVAVGEGHNETFEGGEIETGREEEVDQPEAAEGDEDGIVAGVGVESGEEAFLGVAMAGVGIADEEREDGPGEDEAEPVSYAPSDKKEAGGKDDA